MGKLGFHLAVFLSGLLLFQIQPVIGNAVLPFFGGSANVWNTCMLFFQSLLLGGYFFAHVISRASVLWQVGVHSGLMLICSVTMRLLPQSQNIVTGEADPTGQILWLLLGTVGSYYFLLSATSPLLQRWYTICFQESPYRLYASSNAGSLLGLLLYPFLFEPYLTLSQQESLWRGGFLALFALFAAMLIAFHQVRPQPLSRTTADLTAKSHVPGFRWTDAAWWFVLSLVPSVLMLAVINKVTVDIASFPLLWVIPLSLYLLSFVICFDHPRWYLPRIYQVALILSLAVAGGFVGRWNPFLATSAGILVLVLFLGCLVCHGELYRRRPDPRYLTWYYLTIACGGACGGLTVAIIAPRVFTSYSELPLACAACVGLSLYCRPWRILERSGAKTLPGERLLLGALGAWSTLAWLSRDFLGGWLPRPGRWIQSLALTPVEYFALCAVCAVLLGSLLACQVLPRGGTTPSTTRRRLWAAINTGIITSLAVTVAMCLMDVGSHLRLPTAQTANWKHMLFSPILMLLAALLVITPVLRWFHAIAGTGNSHLRIEGQTVPAGEEDPYTSYPWLMTCSLLSGLVLWESLTRQLPLPNSLWRLAGLMGAFVLPLIVPGLQSRSAMARTRVWVTCMVVSLIPALVRNSVTSEETGVLVEYFSTMVLILTITSLAAGLGNVSSKVADRRLQRQLFAGSAVAGLMSGAVVSDCWPDFAAASGSLWLVIGVALAGYLFSSAEARVVSPAYQGLGITIALLGFAAAVTPHPAGRGIVLRELRNFYGVLRIVEYPGMMQTERVLEHGFIVHGYELIASDETSSQPHRHEPTAYFARNTGIGQLLGQFPPERPKRVGILGLGVATLAAYGERGDLLRFYEIDPAVVDCAEQYFSYLRECPADKEIMVGDGRLAMERESDQQYDVLAIDAFAGDAVPAHLLTTEAVSTYLRHLKPDGFLVFNISNTHLDLSPIVNHHARHYGLNVKYVFQRRPIGELAEMKSLWAILSRGRLPPLESAPHPPISERLLRWSDSHHSILPLIRRSRPGRLPGSSQMAGRAVGRE